MLLGLKINGEPVTDLTEVSWEIIEPALGSMSLKAKWDGKSIKLVWVEHYIKSIGRAGPPTVQHLFRAYILYLIGTRLMPNYTGNLVHLKWLPLLVKLP